MERRQDMRILVAALLLAAAATLAAAPIHPATTYRPTAVQADAANGLPSGKRQHKPL